MKYFKLLLLVFILSSCAQNDSSEINVDILITGGMVYTGHDTAGEILDIAISEDQIVYVGPHIATTG